MTLSNIQANWREAMLYERQPDGSTLCRLCAHFCEIKEGQQGFCRVRENRGGRLYALAAYQLSARHVDSIEKKPLFHFYPGSSAYSIAAYGCNFRCGFCTNWMVSQAAGEQAAASGEALTPQEIVSAAQAARCRSIAYTYIEPTIFFEFINDIARLAKAAGVFNVFKSNGFMSAEMLDSCRPFLDAANVDLKAFRDLSYQRFGGRLQPVLDNLKRMKANGVWLEVTTVLIPGVNDDDAELQEMAEFIAVELGVETPWHLGRFFPAYKMTNTAPTPVETLRRARAIGLKQGLRYVYASGIPDKERQDTLCHNCGCVLIERKGFDLLANHLESGNCPHCAAVVSGIGMGNT
ncbi:MAG: pyruvate formate lyase activating enzyme [Blastocatellia bacterium]|jgi:pyruvate formate lyase activating enzyme|nr:pyruvate formate lyase activating enzyme [Blastocatellia bacterium]